MPALPPWYSKKMGFPFPSVSGHAQRDFQQAIQRMSPMDMEIAIRQGASCRCPNAQGRLPLHQLFDAAQAHPHYQQDLRRLMACVRVAFMHGATTVERHPRTGETALYRASAWAQHPLAAAWWSLWRSRGSWQTPGHPSGRSALVAWRENAHDSLLPRLPRPNSLSPSAPRRSPGP